MSHAAEIRACRNKVLETSEQQNDLSGTNSATPQPTSMKPLTIEGLGAELAVRSGHSTEMTRRGYRVTQHALHLLTRTSR